MADEVLQQGILNAETTVYLEPKDDPRDRIELEIGDAKQPEFHPQIKVKRWDNEYNLSARLVHDEANPEVIQEGDAVRWIGENVEAAFYEVPKSEFFPDGATEFDITQAEYAPVQFTLNLKGLYAAYQPIDLAPEELALQEQLNTRIIRDDHAKGSWAFFAKDVPANYVGGKEYKSGKFGHWYRGKIYDVNGLWAWLTLDLSIDDKTETGVMTVSCQDQDFLKKAVGPFRHAAGATFGYTTAGSSHYDWGSTQGALLTKGNVTTDAVVDNIKLYASNNSYGDTAAQKGGVWKVSDKTLLSNGVSPEYTGIPNGLNGGWSGPAWYTVPYSTKPDLLASVGDYYAGILVPNANYLHVYYDYGASNGGYDFGHSYSSPTTLGTISSDTILFSIYATYTASIAITASTTSLSSFGSVNVGSNSSEQTFTVSAVGLTANLVVTAPSSDFQVSLSSGSGFGSSVSITPSGGVVGTTTIYVRFTPQSGGAKSGDVACTSTGATTKNVSVSGTGLNVYTLTAAQGSFASTGQTAGLLKKSIVTAAQGSFASTGQAAGVLKKSIVTAAQGSFTFTGQNANLTGIRYLAAAYSVFSLTGQNAGLLYSRYLVSAYGSFSMTGQAAALAYPRSIAATYTTFSLTGQSANLQWMRWLVAAMGSFSLAGQDAGLSLVFSLSAGQGSFALTGQDAAFLLTYILAANQGSLSLAGQDAGVLKSSKFAADQGSLVLSGQSAGVVVNYVLGSGAGSFAFTGQAVGLQHPMITVTGTPLTDFGSVFVGSYAP